MSAATSSPERATLYRLPPDQPVPAWVWHADPMLAALAERDICAVFRMLRDLGLSQRRIAARTGQQQSEISEIFAGRRVVAYDLLARISDGLGIPRGLLGLANQPPGMPPELPPDDPPTVPPHSVARTVLVRQCERCTAQPVINTWTGREVRLLREAMRMSVRDFAAHLGISDRMVSKWESGPGDVRPRPVNQAALDTTLRRADDAVRRRFATSLLEQPFGR
jgi:transcriptional regulator with XRE-family HTH domain